MNFFLDSHPELSANRLCRLCPISWNNVRMKMSRNCLECARNLKPEIYARPTSSSNVSNSQMINGVGFQDSICSAELAQA